MTGLRIHTERPALLGCGEKLFGHFQSQLVGSERVVEVGPLRFQLAVVAEHHPFQVGSVLAHPHIDDASFGIVKDLDGVDFSSVDPFEVDPDQLL